MPILLMTAGKKIHREHAREQWGLFMADLSARADLLGRLRSFLEAELSPNGRLLISIAMKDELDYLAAISNFTQEMYAPVTLPEGKMEFRLHARDGVAAYKPVPGFMKVPGPPTHAELIKEPLTSADIALVPSLAANRTGHRLGRGGGYYDRWKNRLIPARKIALLPESLTNLDFPVESHDLRLDGIITPGGFLEPIN